MGVTRASGDSTTEKLLTWEDGSPRLSCCSTCKGTMPLAWFAMRRGVPSRVCLECNRRKVANWYERNRARAHARVKRWNRANPEYKAALNAMRRATYAGLTDAQRARVRVIFRAAQDATRATGVPHAVHHVLPVARGGLTVPENLVVLPSRLNAALGAKHPDNLHPALQFTSRALKGPQSST